MPAISAGGTTLRLQHKCRPLVQPPTPRKMMARGPRRGLGGRWRAGGASLSGARARQRDDHQGSKGQHVSAGGDMQTPPPPHAAPGLKVVAGAPGIHLGHHHGRPSSSRQGASGESSVAPMDVGQDTRAPMLPALPAGPGDGSGPACRGGIGAAPAAREQALAASRALGRRDEPAVATTTDCQHPAERLVARAPPHRRCCR